MISYKRGEFPRKYAEIPKDEKKKKKKKVANSKVILLL